MNTASVKFTWFDRVKTYARTHKFIASIIVLALCYGAFQAYAAITKTATTIRYITSTVATGTVVATLSESGQVSTSHTLTLSPKASGQVIGIYVKPGDRVRAGTVIAQLDATDAQTTLANAKLSLEHEKLSYAQTTASSTLALNLLAAKNAVTNAQISLDKTRDTSYASIATIYTDLGTIITGLDSVLHDSNAAGRPNQENIDAYADLVSVNDPSISIYKHSATASYETAVTAYNSALAAYKATPRTATNDILIALAQTTYTATQTIASAVKDAHDFFDRVNNDYTLYNYGSSSSLSNLLSTTNTYTTTVSNGLSNALSVRTNIISAEQTLAQAENSLQQTMGGSNTLTVQAADIALRQAQQSVTTAEETLSNYTVIAPFSGMIASVGVQKYDQASSGTSVATLIADGQTAEISVSEADAAQIKVGQKATLTFDALPDVTVAGTVVSIDSIGSISSGVVSYDAVIAFDTKNASILPGMSVTADIVTGTETGIIVPSTALKTSSENSYILVFDPPFFTEEVARAGSAGIETSQAPIRVTVTTGLVGDTETVIRSGLTGNEQIVIKTVTGSSSTGTTASATGSSSSRQQSGTQFRALGPGL